MSGKGFRVELLYYYKTLGTVKIFLLETLRDMRELYTFLRERKKLLYLDDDCIMDVVVEGGGEKQFSFS
jgi:hypothetical protein